VTHRRHVMGFPPPSFPRFWRAPRAPSRRRVPGNSDLNWGRGIYRYSLLLRLDSISSEIPTSYGSITGTHPNKIPWLVF